MDNDFFDQSVGLEDDVPAIDAPDGPTLLINGSYQELEVGAPFLETMKRFAISAGMGKFRVFLNGAEIRKSSVTSGMVSERIEADMKLEIRPYDEAG